MGDIGKVVWQDLTVQDAEGVKDFYCDVVGWKASEQSMGDYSDFNIQTPGAGETIAGICHSKGTNANIPPQWLIYVTVESVGKSAETCTAKGGKVLDGPRPIGNDHFCVIQDPAGAVMALYGAE